VRRHCCISAVDPFVRHTLTVAAGLDTMCPKNDVGPPASEAPPSRSLSRPPLAASPLLSAIAMIATALTPDPAPMPSRAGADTLLLTKCEQCEDKDDHVDCQSSKEPGAERQNDQ
jgi:hypothetical protein